MNLAFFQAIWQLIEAWLASHSLQSLHRICSCPEGTVSCKCVDVHFKRLLVIFGILDSAIRRLYWIWAWVQKEGESIFFACFGLFPLKLCDIERVAKLALKDGRLKLVTKGQVLKLESFLSEQVMVPLVGAEGNQSRWRKVLVDVRFEVDRVEG